MNAYLFIFNDNDSRLLLEDDDVAKQYATEELSLLHKYHPKTRWVRIYEIQDDGTRLFVDEIKLWDLNVK